MNTGEFAVAHPGYKIFWRQSAELGGLVIPITAGTLKISYIDPITSVKNFWNGSAFTTTETTVAQTIVGNEGQYDFGVLTAYIGLTITFKGILNGNLQLKEIVNYQVIQLIKHDIQLGG